MTQNDNVWVVNASPLITLAKIGRLDLLTRPGCTLLIPKQVSLEVHNGSPEDPAVLALDSGFGGIPVDATIRPEVLEWGLGLGESAVISLGLQHHATVVLDDRDARAAARTLGLHPIGTLGVVAAARADNRITLVAPIIDALRRVGLRLDERLIASVLRECGESR